MNVQRAGRPAVGETVTLERFGVCEVVSNDDASLVMLKSRGGVTFKIGEKALFRALLAAEGAEARRKI